MRCVSPILAAVFFAGCLISYSGAQTTTPPPSTSSPATAAAATTKVAPLFTSGDLVLHNPVEGCSVFVSAVLAAAIIELFLDFFANIKSRYFQRVFASVREETLLVGLMTLVLIFTTSLDILHPKWEALFNYAVMCLLFMVGFFIFIVAATVGLLGMQMNRWKDFEAARIDADNVLTGREIIIRQSRDQFRESAKALKIECHPDLKFTDYMRKCTRHTVASVCDLNWKSWMALSIMIIINGVRSKISYGSIDATVNVSRSDRTANAISYICFIGYSTLGVYVLLSFLLHHRLATFSEKRIAVDSEQILSSSKHLFFAKQSTTCHIFQSIVIILEWYLALFALGMASELYNEFGGLAFLFYAAAVIPVLIFVYMLPWTITTITILSILGSDLNKEEIDTINKRLSERLVSRTVQILFDNPDEWRGNAATLHEDADVPLDDMPTAIASATFQHPTGFQEAALRPTFPSMLQRRNSTSPLRSQFMRRSSTSGVSPLRPTTSMRRDSSASPLRPTTSMRRDSSVSPLRPTTSMRKGSNVSPLQPSPSAPWSGL